MIIWYFQNFKKPKISSRKIFPKFRNKDQTDFSKNALQMVNQTYPVFYRTVVNEPQRIVPSTGTFGTTREDTKNRFQIRKSRFFGIVQFFVKTYGMVSYGTTLRYGSIYTVRLFWCDLVYFLMPHFYTCHQLERVGGMFHYVRLPTPLHQSGETLTYAIPSNYEIKRAVQIEPTILWNLSNHILIIYSTNDLQYSLQSPFLLKIWQFRSFSGHNPR